MSSSDSVRPRLRTGVLVFAAVLWPYVYFFQGGGWNQNARWDLVRALVEQRTFRINTYAQNTYDIAIVFDRTLESPEAVYNEYKLYLDRGWLDDWPVPIYANKPPGLSWAAVPLYVPVCVAERALGVDPGGFWGANVSVHVLTALVVAVPGALLGFWMLRMLRRITPLPPAWCVWVALCGALGTLLWPYATGLYSHTVAAALLFRAWEAVEVAPPADQTYRRAALVGALLGAAVAVEYSAAPVVLLLAVRAVSRWQNRSALVGALLGLAPWVLALGVYHTCLFGSPWTTSYRFQRPHLHPGLPAELFHAPDPRVWLALLVLPHRGLLVTSPVLALGLVGSVAWVIRGRNWVPLAVLAYYLVLTSCWAEWRGGSALGPRYLIPAIPFLMVAIGACRRGWTKWALAVLGPTSIGLMLLGTSVRVEVPDREHLSPAAYVLDRFFTRNNLSTNPQHVTEVSAHPRPGQPAYWPRRFASYNLGELLGLRGRTSLIPLVAGWLILVGTAPVLRRLRRLRRAPHA